jgi:hypothetical protein
MNRYGQAAINAVQSIRNNSALEPEQAWEIATIKIFGEGTAMQLKGCPKNSFLALCETGKVQGVQAGLYTRSKKNKSYALYALKLLRQNPFLANDPKNLWTLIPGCDGKDYNYQMDVVLALWNENLIGH